MNGLNKEVLIPQRKKENIVDNSKLLLKEPLIKAENITPNYVDKKKIVKITLPNYKIERVEEFPGSLDLGRIFVTIGSETRREDQLALCRKLKNDFQKFSSIIICLYVNSSAGIELAKGIKEEDSILTQKKSWLSMYTFNKIEGEYFDGSPNNYLGFSNK